MFPPRNCHPLITSPPKPQHNWRWNGKSGTIGTKTRQSCQHIQMEGSHTHPLFSCCHRAHMRTLHVFFLNLVSRGLQLISVIAPSIHTEIHTHTHELQPHPSFSTSFEFGTTVLLFYHNEHCSYTYNKSRVTCGEKK